MRWGFVAVILVVVLHANPTIAQGYPGPYNTQIEFAYREPSNAAYRTLYERLRERQVLEELAQFLAPLRLPRKLVVTIDQCGARRRPYKRESPIAICYEL